MENLSWKMCTPNLVPGMATHSLSRANMELPFASWLKPDTSLINWLSNSWIHTLVFPQFLCFFPHVHFWIKTFLCSSGTWILNLAESTLLSFWLWQVLWKFFVEIPWAVFHFLYKSNGRKAKDNISWATEILKVVLRLSEQLLVFFFFTERINPYMNNWRMHVLQKSLYICLNRFVAFLNFQIVSRHISFCLIPSSQQERIWTIFDLNFLSTLYNG